MLVDAQWLSRENKRLAWALKEAKLKLGNACVEDIDYGTRSTIMTSQLPTTKWHDYLGDPTMADAICDRLLHNAHRLALKGPSRRKEDSATDK